MTPPDPAFTAPDHNAIGADLFVTDGTEARLRISRCTACAESWFPALSQCASCASHEVTHTVSSTTGTVYASSVVRIGPTGFSAPYGLAYVDIDGIRLLAHTQSRQALAPGTAVQLRYAPITHHNDDPVMSYAAVPHTQEGQS
ncbi:hypothetical protein BH10ACT9_BH10ACT9_45630 [soil metagenome]